MLQGWHSGPSKNTHLVIVKSSLNIADIHYAFASALDDILTRNRRRKAVILFPHTSTDRYGRLSTFPKNWLAIKGLIQEAFNNDVPVVAPAGNGANARVPIDIDSVPALWGIQSTSVSRVLIRTTM